MRKFLSVLLALMMVVSTVSFAAPAVVTVADSATDAVAENATEVTTEEVAELAAESDYGTLVYSIDFERSDFDVTKFSTAYASLMNNPTAAYLNTDFNFSNVTTYSNGLTPNTSGVYDGIENAKLVTENGNTYIQGDVNAGYDGYFRMTKYTNPWPDGQYTFSVDIKVPAGQASSLAAQCNDTKIALTNLSAFNKANGDWQTVVYQTTNVVSGDNTVDDGIYGFFVAPNNAVAGTVAYDNWKVYYKAPTATVTIDPNGRTGNSEVWVEDLTANSQVNVAELVAKAQEMDSDIIGLAEEPTGPVIGTVTHYVEYYERLYAVYGMDITVMANGNSDVQDMVLKDIDTRTSYTVDEIIALFNSTAVTDRILRGVSNTSNGEPLAGNTVINKSQTLYLLWETDGSEFGTLLASIDFEDVAAGTVLTDNAKVELLDPDALTNGEFTINWQVGKNTVAQEDLGNKYVRGGQGWAQFIFNNPKYNDANAPMPEGKYTILANAIDFGTTKRIVGATCQKYNNVTATTEKSILDSFTGENNKWDLVVGQWNGSSNDMTIYFTDGAATDVGFDNIKLYFEPASDAVFSITVDTNGRTDVSNKVAKVNNGSKITAGELAALMTGCAGVSLTENGEALPADYVITPKYNMTVYALWEYEESEYGTLLFQIDFEKDGISLPEGESRIPVKDIATVYNKDLVFGNNIMFSAGKQSGSSPLDNREIVTEDGNKYFKADFSDLEEFEYYTFFSIFEQENKVEWMDGTYTLVADFKTDMPYNGFATHVNNVGKNEDGSPLNILDKETSNVNVWDTVAYQYTGAISNIDYGNGYLSGSLYFAPRISGDSHVNGKISVDNIKLFFKTDETVFTVKNGGNPKVDTLEISVSTTEGITVEEMLEQINAEDSDYKLLGIADTPTGAVLDPATEIFPDYQRTFYMIWERGNENSMRDNQLGKLLFAVDFEKKDLVWNGDSALDGDCKWGKGALVSDVATLYDTELFDGKDFRIRFLTNDRNEKTFNAGIEEDPNGDHFLTGTNGEAGENDEGYNINGTKHPQMFISNNAKIAAGNGIYTVFVEVNGPNGKFDVHTSMTTNADKDYKTREIDFFTYENSAWEYKPDEWNQFAYRYEISDGSIIPMSGAYFSLNEFKQEVSFDNYKLYFKPYTATITLLPGEYEEFGVHTVENISTTGENTAQYILDQLSDHFKAAGKTAVGLVDEDGFELELDAKLIIPCEMTYTILWGEDTHDYVVTQEKNAIRYSPNDKRRGIRFLAETTPAYAYDDTVTEYGWIVTRESMLVNAGISPTCFTKESSKVEGVKVASGQNHGDNVDGGGADGRKHFYTDDEKVLITMVVYGLTKPEQLTENLVARPYMVVNGEIYYGQPWARSMFDTALSIKNNGYEACGDDQDLINYVDEIINTVLESSNDIEFDYGEL